MLGMPFCGLLAAATTFCGFDMCCFGMVGGWCESFFFQHVPKRRLQKHWGEKVFDMNLEDGKGTGALGDHRMCTGVADRFSGFLLICLWL